MTSFLVKKKGKNSYEEKISSAPESTKRNKLLAVKTFERFCQEKYQKSSDEVIGELLKIRKETPDDYESALYGTLQEWINWNKKRGLGNYSIKTMNSSQYSPIHHN